MKDQNSKGLLKFLMGEEKGHLAHFMAMEKGAKKREKAKGLKNPVFSRKAYAKMGGRRANTLSVFNTALGMELESIKFYAGFARKARDKSLKRFLKGLVNFEKNHFRLIKTHQDAIYGYLYWEVRTQGRIET